MEFKKIKLPFRLKKPVLALGSHAKNRVCFARDNFAYLSPAHPDLSNLGDFAGFEKSVKYFLKKSPGAIAYDLHPEYQSTKYALSPPFKNFKASAIQHHHAHIASCMLDNGLSNKKVIGVAFDGTGLGADSRLWGAEFLVCDYKGYRRRAHLQEVPLLGQERAITEPWRLAAMWLYLGDKAGFLRSGINFVNGIDKKKWGVLKRMYLSGFNSPPASSMGRLFDAAASLVLGKYKAAFEAELAIEFEGLAARPRMQPKAYPFKIIKNKEGYILGPLPMFKQMVLDLRKNSPREEIAYRFHLTVADMVKKACLILRKENHISEVALSGGVFQNNLLLSLSRSLLYREGFNVFVHKRLSCNDSGIAPGQAAVANFRS